MEKIENVFENGILKSKGLLRNGQKTGLWLFYFESGKIEMEINFQNGFMHGFFKRWFENGKLAVECEHEDGKPVGCCREYCNDGTLKEEGRYEEDKYKILNFWNWRGENTLVNGTGFRIEAYGFGGVDLFKQVFENSIKISEEQIHSGRNGLMNGYSAKNINGETYYKDKSGDVIWKDLNI